MPLYMALFLDIIIIIILKHNEYLQSKIHILCICRLHCRPKYET